MPTSLPPILPVSVTGIPEKPWRVLASNTSPTVCRGLITTGAALLVLTAMAMAIDDSVTVSMGDEIRGVFRVIFLVNAEDQRVGFPVDRVSKTLCYGHHLGHVLDQRRPVVINKPLLHELQQLCGPFFPHLVEYLTRRSVPDGDLQLHESKGSAYNEDMHDHLTAELTV
ncbi:hypothetical protein EYF80_003624 [Liparis tanakae]|uniref:Uncharacterized protein n=1 Tax=Liparis tanakae TaxID=230148 RepID=A0A4Z2J856_9TELE|nr:hypothetical protein EYF80_003624 [Liparis tanakae]